MLESNSSYAPVGGLPYKVYTALLSQSGTEAPVAVELENTLGGTVVWTRSGIGTYVGTLTGAFSSFNVWCTSSFAKYKATNGSLLVIKLIRSSADTILITIGNPSLETQEDLNEVFFPIEIRVYP